MPEFLNRFNQETRDFAQDFIEEIKQNRIKKIVRPNTSLEFDSNKAYDNFKKLSETKVIDDILNQNYK